MKSFRVLVSFSRNITIVTVFVLLDVWVNAQLLTSAPVRNHVIGASGLSQTSNSDMHVARAQDNTGVDSQAGQSSFGSIIGTILDPTGAVAVGAKVQLNSNAGSLKQEVVSGNNGEFSFSHIPPGFFKLMITAPGFSSQMFSGELRPGQTFLVPGIVLPIATAQAEVRVRDSMVEVAEVQIKEEEKQRVLAFIPNFEVTYDPDAAPLNPKQKFELAWKTAVDPVTFAGAGVYAGFEQAGGRFPEYGQGAQGYAKRYGSGYGDALSGIFIGNAILPSLLKQDPRYFYKGTGSAQSRFLYAIASSVICKSDNKHWQPNYSFMLGSVAVGGVSNLFIRANDRDGVGLVFQNALIRIVQGSLGGVLQEFVLPRLTPHLRHHSESHP